jgi:disulfide bond formation protein DsbB
MDVEQVNRFLAILVFIAQGFVVLAAVALIGGTFSSAIARFRDTLASAVGKASLPLASLVGLTAMSGSLYYSEVAKYPPCPLCWYQRICMYSLALILTLAAIRKDTAVRPYAFLLAAVGAVISIYHYQLERFPEQESLVCHSEVPCNFAWVNVFGFVGLPLMALTGFASIALLLLLGRRYGQMNEKAGML